MKRAVKVRLYPNKFQQQILNQHFSACRFIYNSALNYKMIMFKDYQVKVSKFDILNQLTNVKKDVRFSWLNNVKAECLQNPIDHLDFAYKQFFKGGGYPKFKNKKSKQSFIQKQTFIISKNSNELIFYKQKIKFKCSEKRKELIRNNKINRITYSKDKTGNYFASILIESEIEKLPKLNNEIGIDLGISHFLVTSNKDFISNPKFLNKSEEKLKRVQKQFSRKKKGSNNREKQRIKVAKIYNKITNQREHFLHNISKKLINENQVINLETLKISEMLKDNYLAKSIQDVSWGKFINMINYKAEWYGRKIRRIGTYEPSSKICSSCNWKDDNLTLKDRVFNCKNCGLSLDRDYNASLNILKIGKNHSELTFVESNSIESHGNKKNLIKVVT